MPNAIKYPPSKIEKDKADRSYVEGILEKNKDKDFVKRILEPDKYPSLPDVAGKRKTHKMSWAESEGKYHVYPTIFHKDGKLEDLSAEDPETKKKAYDTARQRKEYIEFDDPDKADWFSKNYKKVWEK